MTNSSIYKDAMRIFHKRLLAIQMRTEDIDNNTPHPKALVFVGPANGRAVAKVRRELKHSTYLLYLYAPCENVDDEVLYKHLRENERTLFVELSNESFFPDKVSMMLTIANCVDVKLSIVSELSDKYNSELARLDDIIKLSIDNRKICKISSLIRLMSSACNLCEISRTGLWQLQSPLPSSGVVVCGAGPSLASQLPLLKKYAHKLVIIAVGHAARTLCDAMITPDFIVEVDPQAGYNWSDDFTPDTTLLSLVSADPSVARRFKQVIWVKGDSGCAEEFLTSSGIELDSIAISRTVTVTAIDFAVKNGCTEILLLGNDFCLSDGGVSHVDKNDTNFYSESSFLKVAGNETAEVATTSDLDELRKAVERYAASIEGIASILNGTAGGARISNAQRANFGEYCLDLSLEKAEIILQKQGIKGTIDTENLGAILTRYTATLESLLEAVRKLQNELTNTHPEMQKVEKLQEALREAGTNESSLRENKVLLPWLEVLDGHVNDTLSDMPDLPEDENDPLTQIKYIRIRYRYILGVVNDLIRIFQTAPSDIFMFSAFRAFAVDFIGRSNRTFAKKLANGIFDKPLDGRFSIFSNWQELPFVTFIDPTGGEVPLNPILGMEQEATKNLNIFVQESGFEPDKNGVIFFAPGNWIHVIEFAKRYPSANIMVVEPWVQLFAAISRRSMFIHYLPEKTIVVASCSECKNWKNIFSKTVATWESSGLKTLYFEHPVTSQIPEIIEIKKELPPL